MATNNFFGTELSIIQAPMAGVKGSYLVISVPFAFLLFSSSSTTGRQYLMEPHEKNITAYHIIFFAELVGIN